MPSFQHILVSLSVFGLTTALNFTSNHNYFNYPAITDVIPVFRIHDIVNVSYSADYPTRNLKLWCGNITRPILIQEWQDLPPKAIKPLEVDATWADPCNFALVSPGPDGTDQTGSYFLSGVFNVAPQTGNSPTTWSLVQTSGALPQTRGPLGKQPGFGPGVGIGITVAIIPAVLATLIYWALSRAKTGSAEPPALEEKDKVGVSELQASRMQYEMSIDPDSRQELA